MTADPREGRLAALRGLLESADIDALIVTSLPNVRYLSGFSGSAAILVVTGTDAVLLTDFRYSLQAAGEVGSAARVVIEPTSLWTRLWALLPQLGTLHAVGFESAHLNHVDHQRFAELERDGARWRWQPTANVVEQLRAAKDDGELAAIRAAVQIAEHALEQTIAGVKAGMSEFDVCGILEGHLRAAGSESHPFETIVASGERSALPHARCSARRVKSGDWLLLDFGAVSGGYCSDITRTFVVGSATADQRELHAVVRESNMTASGAVRAGMRGKDADALARGYIERHGWGEEFRAFFGARNRPRGSRGTAALEDQRRTTSRPGCGHDRARHLSARAGGVRIEDDVFLAAAGPQVLTTFPRELLEIG